jgi:hypothetical protein
VIDFRISADSDRLQRKLNNLINAQLPYATSLAINETLKTLEIYNKDLMAKAFDRPTRFTMNSFYVQYANKRTLTGYLRRKQMVVGRHYLEVQDKGGGRGIKAFENNFKMRLPYKGIVHGVMPTENTPLDSHGNMTMAFINKVSAQLQIMRNPESNTGYAKRTKKGRKSTAVRYMVPDVDHPLHQKGRGGPGVYAVKPDPIGSKRSGSRVTKVMNFAQNVPTYRKRTDFDNKMKRAASRLMPGKMNAGISRALSTARLR